jgi:hypothetical protein
VTYLKISLPVGSIDQEIMVPVGLKFRWIFRSDIHYPFGIMQQTMVYQSIRLSISSAK